MCRKTFFQNAKNSEKKKYPRTSVFQPQNSVTGFSDFDEILRKIFLKKIDHEVSKMTLIDRTCSDPLWVISESPPAYRSILGCIK